MARPDLPPGIPQDGEATMALPSPPWRERFYLKVPQQYSSARKWPLIVCFHGRGGDHRHILRPQLERFNRLALEQGYILLSPDCGSDHWMNYGAMSIVERLLGLLLECLSVDEDRIHLFGVSMGGSSALVFAAHHPDAVASVCSVSGATDYEQLYREGRFSSSLSQAFGGSLEEVPEVYRDLSPLRRVEQLCRIPILLIHGAKDEIIPPHHSRRLYRELVDNGGKVVYHEVSDVGHTVEILRGWEEEILRFFSLNPRASRKG